MRMLGFVIICAFAWFVHATNCTASDAADGRLMLVGVAKVDLTPDTPLRLSGYGSRQVPSEGVAQRLHAKALAFGDDEQLSVLCTLDAIAIPGWVTQALAHRLNEKAGVKRANLVVAASHTHCAPSLEGALPYMFAPRMSPEEREHVKRYTRQVLDKLEVVALQAIEQRRPCQVSWTKGEVTFAGNRRVLKEGRWVGFGTQEDGPVDHTLPLMRVTDAEGKVIALFANYACHCTTLGGTFNEIHGDWAGVAQAEIESRHPGTIALIAIGCGADQNPNPRGALDMAVTHGREVADEVDRLLTQNELSPLSTPPEAWYAEIDLPLEAPPKRDELEATKEQGEHHEVFAESMLQRLNDGKPLPEKVTYPVQTWTFDDDLAMVFLAGEVVVDYAHRFYREYDADRIWVNAYCNDVPCYIPSQRLYAEGGYEVDRSMVFYGFPSRLHIDTEDRVAGAVMRQMPQAFHSEATTAVQPPPVEKDKALDTIRVAPGCRVELVAAEPLVRDPIDIAWGPDGKLWVVEMADYPLGIDGRPGGRVRFLEDTDGDGKYDRSQLFMDRLHFPNAVMPWRDGVLIVTATEIFHAKDTDGDGQADAKEVMLKGFESGNPQHQLAGLCWGLDNQIHVANGASQGTVTSLKSGQEFAIGSRDLRFDPETGVIEPQSGKTQFGLVRDDWEHWFGCNNSNPWWHYALADQYLRRNLHVSYPNPKVLLGRDNPAPPVYPSSKTVSRFNDYDAANRFTSACGMTIYRDNLLGPTARRSVFTAEPVHNLVSRIAIEPQQTTFQGSRVESEQSKEFFTSTDNWSRPTYVRTGPDGALYVVDMYRQVIEHPEWIPERWQWRLNLRAGSDRGRIYRIVPESETLRPTRDLTALDTSELVDALETPNGTVRDLIHQMLLWQDDENSIEPLRRLAQESRLPETRVQALAVLDGLVAITERDVLHALADSHAGVRRMAIRLSEEFLRRNSEVVLKGLAKLVADEDAFVRQQLAYTMGESDDRQAGEMLLRLMRQPGKDPYLEAAILSSLKPHHERIAHQLRGELIELPWRLRTGFIQTVMAAGSRIDRANLLTAICTSAATDQIRWQVLGDAIRELQKRGESLANLGEATEIGPVLAEIGHARKQAADEASEDNRRIAAVGLLGFEASLFDQDLRQLLELMNSNHPVGLQEAAANRVIEMRSTKVAEQSLDGWDQLGSAAKEILLGGMINRGSWALALLERMRENPELSRSLTATQRMMLLESRDETLRTRAGEVFAAMVNSDRAEVLEQFAESLTMSGNAAAGEGHFRKLCATCHRVNDFGAHVGPDLSSLTNRSGEALLTAIVDPNRIVEAKYASYVAVTTDGRALTGVVQAETGSSITLLAADGKQHTVLRSELEVLNSKGTSLMPVGLEEKLVTQDMADLIAYVQGIGATEPISIDEQGKLVLAATEGIPRGPRVRFDEKLHALTMIGPDDAVEWRIAGLPAGRYSIFFYAALTSSSPAETQSFQMRVGDRIVHGQVEETGRLSSFRKRQFAEVRIEDEMRESTIRFEHDLDDGQVSLREIVLIPIR